MIPPHMIGLWHDGDNIIAAWHDGGWHERCAESLDEALAIVRTIGGEEAVQLLTQPKPEPLPTPTPVSPPPHRHRLASSAGSTVTELSTTLCEGGEYFSGSRWVRCLSCEAWEAKAKGEV